MEADELEVLIDSLVSLPRETEWVEFKENNDDAEYIGRCCSALSNSARLADHPAGFLVFGIRDGSHEKVGTSVDLNAKKVGNEPFLNWLTRSLYPDAKPEFFSLEDAKGRFQIIRVQPAQSEPTRFGSEAYVRIGSAIQPLHRYPQRASDLWLRCSGYNFESAAAVERVDEEAIRRLIDVPGTFQVFGRQEPTDFDRVREFLSGRGVLTSDLTGKTDITNVGALLFAKDVRLIPSVSRKVVRVIRYEGRSKLTALREEVHLPGYAIAFEELMRSVIAMVPGRERIEGGRRQVDRIVPDVALREVIVNALFHQDLSMRGSGPMVEIYDDRVEVSNPGSPLVDVQRLMDTQPRSRNELMGVLLREIGVCEERGSGIDRVVASLEDRILPGPRFIREANGLRVTLQAAKAFGEMTKDERLRSCYWHACLRHLQSQQMTNSSLRVRLGVKQSNYPQVSKVIADALSEELIRPYDPENRSQKHARYVPFWA